MEKTGDILKRYLSNGSSQTELGKEMGVSPQYINNIINNIKGPSDNFLEKFYKIFEVSEEDKMKIEEIETLKKLPSKYKEELLQYRNFNKETNEISKISLVGEIFNNKIFYYEDKLIKELFFPKISIEDKLLFAIKKSDSNNGFLIFEKFKNFFETINEEKLYFVKYNDEFKIKKLEYVPENETLILKSAVEKEKSIKEKSILVNINGSKNFEIIGVFRAKFEWD